MMDRPTDIPGVERVFQKGDFKAGVVYYYLQRVADALLYSPVTPRPGSCAGLWLLGSIPGRMTILKKGGPS